MQKIDLTPKIMSKVALYEEGRIHKIIGLTGFFSLALIFLLGFAFYSIFSNLAEQGILDLLSTIEFNWENLHQQLSEVFWFAWEGVEIEIWITLFISAFLSNLFLKKIIMFSLPSRFKQIAKYKNWI